MHRLGFEVDELAKLADFLTTSNRLVVKSVFSHFVSSENPAFDNFTRHRPIFLHTPAQL